MKALDQSARRLLIQAAFAAANHRLASQIEALYALLPELVDDEGDRQLCRAIMLAGLNRGDEALALIARRDDPEARAVRAVLAGEALQHDSAGPAPQSVRNPLQRVSVGHRHQ
ncbi:EscG/YscG/SsaH family type III secretion system needle protein co-chaperone [Burkholderia sp. WSM2232]|uniref:EscG/YscG/SsaH family type III secretion system needle protein co-chaperone n=1 Tax=Burkholderia sp. WSM2232 TaxID=944436 RepID=UPI000404E5F9|nr:EscG/YscG/SsaH family type III secretion system needle protein co-chaperone [Burkholderia sp. WSM2232]